MGCGMECATVHDEEQGRAWAVALNVQRCMMENKVERGLWH